MKKVKDKLSIKNTLYLLTEDIIFNSNYDSSILNKNNDEDDNRNKHWYRSPISIKHFYEKDDIELESQSNYFII